MVEVAGGFQLLSRAKFAPWLRRLQAVPGEVRLSVPALETLAVVAYRQPVLRADVEAVRGVQCGEILRQLMERGLVRIVGKSEELGRPFLYGTTRQFLQVFGLRDLDQLPRPEWPRAEVRAAEDREVPVLKDRQEELSNQLGCSNNPGGDLTVKTTNHTDATWESDLATPVVATMDLDRSRLAAGPKDYEEEEFDEEEDEDLDDEDEEDDEDLDDEDLDDEDFEDSDWEEVEDEEDGEEDEEEDEELEDEDEEEDWDDEDEDWEDEDEDWDEEEEEEEADED